MWIGRSTNFDHNLGSFLGGGNSNIFGIFTPILGEMIQFDLRLFFQMGGSTNHQLALEEKHIQGMLWNFVHDLFWITMAIVKTMLKGTDNFKNHGYSYTTFFGLAPKYAQSQQEFHVKLISHQVMSCFFF